MIQYTRGDATDLSSTDGVILAVLHICNDRGGWGRGFVLAVSKRWPQPEEKYRRLFHGGRLVLGTIQVVPVGNGIVVVNMIAQSGYRRNNDEPPINYEALDECLATFRKRADRLVAKDGLEVHMPRIGCGLAGGHWEEIEPIIEKHLGLFPVTVYDWPSTTTGTRLVV